MHDEHSSQLPLPVSRNTTLAVHRASPNASLPTVISSSMGEKLVSIGMPVHNGAQFLEDALRSLLSQDFNVFELIISDNGSSDGTAEICQRYSATDSRISYLRSDENRGAAWNFQRVLDLASGELFMWAAHDDLWESDYLSSMVRLLEGDESAVLAFSYLDRIDAVGLAVEEYRSSQSLLATDEFDRLRNYMMQDHRLGKANMIYGLMRVDALRATGGLSAWSFGQDAADMLLVCRLLSFGVLALEPRVLFHKRVSGPELALQHGSLLPLPERRLRLKIARLRLWSGYFRGFFRIVRLSPTLSTAEKFRLRLVLARRLATILRLKSRYFLVTHTPPTAKKMVKDVIRDQR